MKKYLFLLILSSFFITAYAHADSIGFGYWKSTAGVNNYGNEGTCDGVVCTLTAGHTYAFIDVSTSTQIDNFSASDFAGTNFFTASTTKISFNMYKFTAPTTVQFANAKSPAFGVNCEFPTILNTVPRYCAYEGSRMELFESVNTASLPTVQILYPQNNANIFIHDFTNFTFSAQNTDTNTHNYIFKIVYDTTSTLDFQPRTISRNISYPFTPNTTHFLDIPKTEYLASSTQYWAELCTYTDGNNISNCTNVITFKTGNISGHFQVDTSQAGFLGSTTTEVGILYPPVANNSVSCDVTFYDPSSWACWTGLQITKTFDTLKDYAVAGFTTLTSSTLTVFPVNVIYQFNADLASLQATTTDYTVHLQGQGSMFKKAGGGYFDFVLLTSSTINNTGVISTGFDWQQFIVYIIYAMTGISIVGIAFVILHKGHTPHA